MASLENLVPKKERDHLMKNCSYEVLCFYTFHEFNETNTESEMKKKIFAKFRDYNDALEYAEKQSEQNCFYHVILRV